MLAIVLEIAECIVPTVTIDIGYGNIVFAKPGSDVACAYPLNTIDGLGFANVQICIDAAVRIFEKIIRATWDSRGLVNIALFHHRFHENEGWIGHNYRHL